MGKTISIRRRHSQFRFLIRLVHTNSWIGFVEDYDITKLEPENKYEINIHIGPPKGPMLVMDEEGNRPVGVVPCYANARLLDNIKLLWWWLVWGKR